MRTTTHRRFAHLRCESLRCARIAIIAADVLVTTVGDGVVKFSKSGVAVGVATVFD